MGSQTSPLAMPLAYPMASALAGLGGVVSPLTSTQYGIRMWDRAPDPGITETAAGTYITGGASTIIPLPYYWCSHICCDGEAPFDSFRLIFANRNAVSVEISGFSYAAGYTATDRTNSTYASRLSFTRGTFVGGTQNNLVVGAGTDNVPTYAFSDEMTCASVTRLGGDATTWSVSGGSKIANAYTLPLLHLRIATPTIANGLTQVMALTPNINVTNSPQSTVGVGQPNIYGRILSVANAASIDENLSIGSATALTANNGGTSGGNVFGPFCATLKIPIVGIIFKYRNKVVSIAHVGDSMTIGALASGVPGEQPLWGNLVWSKISTMQLSDLTNSNQSTVQPYEFARLARGGQGSSTYAAYLDQFMAGLAANGARYPNIVIMPSVSPNDGDTNETTLRQMVDAAKAKGSIPVIWLNPPPTAAVPWSDANVLKWFNLNQAIRDGTKFNDAQWVEMCNTTPSLTDGASPQPRIPVAYSDALRIHLNEAGDVIQQGQVKAKYQTLATGYF